MNENEDKLRETVSTVKSQYIYYFLIGIISFIALVFLPFVGSTIGLDWNIPDTIVGWIVWIAVRLAIAIINVLLFDCFRKQAKINVRNDKRFIDSNEILLKTKNKTKKPRSPIRYNSEIWLKKGTTIFFSSLLATIALTQAILTYDWMSMLTYLFTVVMGIVFGIIQMKSDEIYWTEEYYEYALYIKELDNDNNRQ